MSKIKEVFDHSRKIIIKIGSNVLSTDDGVLDKNKVKNIVDQVGLLLGQGKQVVIVSSGAGISGAGAIHKWSRMNDENYKQALCAIGQVELMMAYKEFFADYDLHVGQILLAGSDFEDDQRTLHIRNTLFTLLDEGVIPIINENDSVNIDEIKIGDNDTLSALTAILWNADLLVCLSDIDGVYDKNPKEADDAELIHVVYDIDKLMDEIDTEGKSSFGTGGIETKIRAAGMVGEYGIDTVLLNGNVPDVITSAAAGETKGTYFPVQNME